ncbi:MAG: hypothetical protein KIT33_06455 [Candidatus Kapabacteria bacterium]|nr:hypothetical protein [Ignavibacteriota bacterium]MCW5884596.1 hypothetical protein [Candidatus Kapabacteria bacterium]
MKRISVLIATFLVILIIGCTENPVYNDNYYANIRTEFYTLNPNGWRQVPNNSIQWYQEFRLPTSGFSNYDYVGVMVYYLNQFDAWEALPSTRIFWTDNDVVYSDELWFSHNLQFLYIDYRNTIPGIATAPKDAMRIKAVYFDDAFYRSKTYKDIDWNDYNKVKEQLNLKD